MYKLEFKVMHNKHNWFSYIILLILISKNQALYLITGDDTDINIIRKFCEEGLVTQLAMNTLFSSILVTSSHMVVCQQPRQMHDTRELCTET